MRNDARTVAVHHLLEVDRGQPSDAISRRSDFLGLPENDRRLAMQLTFGALRRRAALDHLLGSLTERSISSLDREVLWIARLGLYQLEALRIPPRAAVHETVGLCRRFRKSSAAGFVNAILRSYLRNPPALPTGDSAEALSVRYSHPSWLVTRYLGRYGLRGALELLERNNREPAAALWVNPFRSSAESLSNALRQEGIDHQVDEKVPGCLLVSKSLVLHPLYQQGHGFFMDSASQAVAHSLRVEGARIVGDFCAAPGGKSFVLASRLEPGTLLVCCDVSHDRLTRMTERARLYAVPGLVILEADLECSAPFRPVFDAILTDVPCSGLGTLASNPEIRWRIHECELKVYQERQLAILRNSFRCLAKGGELTYSTCSTEPEENEEVIARFLAEEPDASVAGEPHRNYPGGQFGDCFFRVRVRHRSG